MAAHAGRTPSRATIDRHADAVYRPFAMLAGMQLDVFTPLKDGRMSAEALASALGVRAGKLAPLLYALVVAELLTVEDGVFANTPEAGHFLVRGRPSYMDGAHERYSELWRATLETAASIRTGEPRARRDFAAMPEHELLAFFRGSHPNTLAAGREVAALLDLSGARHLLDVAGGSGGLAIAACESHPGLRATVLDLPSVTPFTEHFVAEAGMAGRIGVLAADVVERPPEASFDIAVLRNFIQVLSRDHARRALRHVARALEPGGVACIVGYVLDDSHLSPPDIAASNFAFLNLYDEGQAYTEREYRDWLADAGLVDFERRIISGEKSVVTARKTGAAPG